MKNILLVLGFAIVVGLTWVFFHDTQTPITNYPPKNETIVAFGDSLVRGQGSTEGSDFVSVLSQRLGRPIHNLGVRGNTTRDGIARLSEVLDRDPGIVILLLGGNDFIRRVDDAEIEENLSALIEAFQAQGAVIVLLGVRSGILSNKGEEMYERLSKKYGAVFMPDVLDGIYLKRELMSDSIHPNDAGYAKIAERIHALFIENNM